MVLKGSVAGVLLLFYLIHPSRSSGQTAGVAPLETSGFVDFYYSRNFYLPASQQNKFSNFDSSENQFSPGLAGIVFQRKAEPAGFRIDADFGPAKDVVQSGASKTPANLQQAYATAVIPIGNGVIVDAGKFVTHQNRLLVGAIATF